MINWYYYPLSDSPTQTVKNVVKVFEDVAGGIDSATHSKQVSDQVLVQVAKQLQQLGFAVETGKQKNQKI